MEITIGRTVLYKLHDSDAHAINRRRTTGESIAQRISTQEWSVGCQAHIGSEVKAGDVFPMIVVRVLAPGYVNGQVLLDGNDTYWATSVYEGTEGHTWQWPLRN